MLGGEKLSVAHGSFQQSVAAQFVNSWIVSISNPLAPGCFFSVISVSFVAKNWILLEE